MRDKQPGRHAGFFPQSELRLRGPALFAFLNERGELWIAFRRMLGDRMFRRDGAKCHAHDGVGAGGEHVHPALLDWLAVAAGDLVRKRKAHAFALAYPVFLHQSHALGPAGQLVGDRVEQLVGVLRDGKVIAGNFALFHRRAGAPAAPVDDLLVGEYGLVDWVPVHNLGLAVGNTLFQHFQE